MLSQTAIYALRAVGYIATRKDESPVLARTIAEEMGIPQNYLSKIVNRLAHVGLLRSVRGMNGGFLLTKAAEEIRVIDVISDFMNPQDIKMCFLGLDECKGSCKIYDKCSPIGKQIEKLLVDSTIDQLF